MSVRSGLSLLIVAASCIACTRRADPNVVPASPMGAFVSPSIERLDLYVRNWPDEFVELTLVRRAGQSTVTLFRPAHDGRPRFVFDSIGPGPKDAEMVVALLDSFDVWSMAAPDAPGGACRTKGKGRNCAATTKDYTVVMGVKIGGEYRAQRYTQLEKRTALSARALGDFILEWARQPQGRKQRP